MSTQGIGTGKAAATTPLTTSREVSPTDKLLFSRMEPLMPLAVMLSREGFPAHGTNKRSFICMSPEVGSQVVRPCKALWAEMALERCRMFLDPFRVTRRGTGSLWVSKVEDIIATVD